MKKLLLIAMTGMFACSAFAELEEISEERCWTPVQLNLASPIGLPWGDRSVYGLRANIFYGYSLNVSGLDFGMVAHARNNVYGIQANAANIIEGQFRGIQLGAVANYTVRPSYGVQLGGVLNWLLDDSAGLEVGFVNVSGGYTGIQLGGALNWDDGYGVGLDAAFANVARTDFTGCQLGVANYCKGTLQGCQIGIFNMAFGRSDGLQLGVFNASDEHRGVQIGLLNLNVAGTLPIMAVVNVNFR